MKSASPFVVVDNCKESVEYYQSIFGGGDIKILNKHEGKIMHAELHLGSSLIHFSDTFGRIPKAENVKIILQLESEEEIRETYDLLLQDGEVTVELQDTFFNAIHGQVTDNKNGICWVLNYMK
ncbi:VOC family protein [Bacillus atrophaeus]|uniref:VOC family protein n=1 Tax=Bacillus atrophaeus TaxID=1452 RepID=UPI001EFBC828|nr:VOC family protein [Bacillus atrophaeus]MCG8397653.1 VOC family protein [Bacillus atrophaeus]